MRHRLAVVVAAALMTVAAGAGCSQPQTVAQSSARVTVGDHTYTTRAPQCTQLQSFRTITIADHEASVEAVVLLTGQRTIPQWVKIRDFGGFTGSFWQNGVGDAAASLGRTTLTITGSAYGIQSSNPNRSTTTSFEITAKC